MLWFTSSFQRSCLSLWLFHVVVFDVVFVSPSRVACTTILLSPLLLSSLTSGAVHVFNVIINAHDNPVNLFSRSLVLTYLFRIVLKWMCVCHVLVTDVINRMSVGVRHFLEQFISPHMSRFWCACARICVLRFSCYQRKWDHPHFFCYFHQVSSSLIFTLCNNVLMLLLLIHLPYFIIRFSFAAAIVVCSLLFWLFLGFLRVCI